jgi:hypothetical protein
MEWLFKARCLVHLIQFSQKWVHRRERQGDGNFTWATGGEISPHIPTYSGKFNICPVSAHLAQTRCTECCNVGGRTSIKNNMPIRHRLLSTGPTRRGFTGIIACALNFSELAKHLLVPSSPHTVMFNAHTVVKQLRYLILLLHQHSVVRALSTSTRIFSALSTRQLKILVLVRGLKQIF